MTTPFQEQLSRREVTATKLSDVGIDPERAQALLVGADPTIEEVRKVAASFNIPVRQLVSASRVVAERQLKVRENFRAVVRGEGADEILEILSRAETLAEVLPDRADDRILVEVPSAEKDYEAAERLASFCQVDLFGLDAPEPLIDLERRISNHTQRYVLVSRYRRVEGSSILVDGRAFIFLAERNDPRMRFTLAHELCHSLVDMHNSEGAAWFDDDVFHPPVADYRLDENFANAFAAALLLPPDGVGRVLSTARRQFRIRGDEVSDVEVLVLSRFFGVSFQVAARRCEDLKLIPRGAGQALYSEVRKAHGSPEKLAEHIGLQPRETYSWGAGRDAILRDVAPSVIQGAISIGRLAEVLQINSGEAAYLLSQWY